MSKYLCAIFVYICSFYLVAAQNKEISWDDLSHYTPLDVRYDTLEGVFFSEIAIIGYIRNDRWVKSGNNFVKQIIPFSKEVYQNGYFIFNNKYLQKIERNNPLVHYELTSLDSAFELMYGKNLHALIDIESCFNPIYGSYYKKYRMKIEVLYLGEVLQRIPLFVANKLELDIYMENNNGQYYELRAIPTYIITNVFELEEL